jgi:hypothetical protein
MSNHLVYVKKAFISSKGGWAVNGYVDNTVINMDHVLHVNETILRGDDGVEYKGTVFTYKDRIRDQYLFYSWTSLEDVLAMIGITNKGVNQ